jgi:hypothetical protein
MKWMRVYLAQSDNATEPWPQAAALEERGRLDEDPLGLDRIVALHHRSSSPYQIY